MLAISWRARSFGLKSIPMPRCILEDEAGEQVIEVCCLVAKLAAGRTRFLGHRCVLLRDAVHGVDRGVDFDEGGRLFGRGTHDRLYQRRHLQDLLIDMV